MNMEFVRKLPSPEELKAEFPISEKAKKIKAERDEEIRAVFEGKSDKLILVIGPCSADHEDPVLDYISRLRNVQDKVADKILMILIWSRELLQSVICTEGLLKRQALHALMRCFTRRITDISQTFYLMLQ